MDASKSAKMDMSFFLAEDNFSLTYVSCIEIDGYPILPPVMTEAKRLEMRNYRELAVERERRRREEKEIQNDEEISIESSCTVRRNDISESSSSKPKQFFNESIENSSSSPEDIILPHSPEFKRRNIFDSPSPLQFTKELEGAFKKANSEAEDIRIANSSPKFRRRNIFESPSPLHFSKEPISKTEDSNDGISASSPRFSKNISESSHLRQFANETLWNSKSGPDDIILSRSIPSSAENSPPEKLVAVTDKETIFSDCDNSDKENHSFKKKHVRKLSYTLLTPSAELLAASKQGIGPIPLEPLMSVPSSVGIPSVTATPEKPTYQNKAEPPTPTTEELDARLDSLNDAVHKLQQLNLRKGKKAHLERFLGDQRVVEQQNREGKYDNVDDDNITNNAMEERTNEDEEQRPSDMMEQSPSTNDSFDVELRFRRLQEQHEKQLGILAEMHRQQQIKMEQQFAQEKEKILFELKKHKSNRTSIASSVQSSKTKGLIFSPSSQISGRSTKFTKNNDCISQGDGHVFQANNPLMIAGTGIKYAADNVHSLAENRILFDNSNQGSSKYRFNNDQSSDESLPIVSSNAQSAANIFSGFSIANQNQLVDTPTPEPLAYVGLSKLQARMQALSPSCFKSQADSRSPLLKGLIFLDPLHKPQGPIKIPAQISDPILKLKFEKVTAAVKGYLTRRLLHSEKIQLLIQTIRDTVALVLKVHEEAPEGHAATFMVRPQDADLHRRLLQQLGGACGSFHDVFFKLTPTERMAIIATDREKLKAKALKNLMNTASNSTAHKRNISVATLKCLERRLSLNRSAGRKDIATTTKKIRSSMSHQSGSQSVKPKVVSSYKISPKRRRLSYFDRDQMIKNRVTKPGRLSTANASADASRNRWKTSGNIHKKASSQNVYSSRSDNSLGFRKSNANTNLRSSRSNHETFIVPSNCSSSRSRPPTGSSQSTEPRFSIGQGSTPRGIRVPSAPWK